jgi:alpha-L-rhamnosidase
MKVAKIVTAIIAGIALTPCVPAQRQAQGPTAMPNGRLDPARYIAGAQLESATHVPLPEQYIWTKEDAQTPITGTDQELGIHYFRRSFQLNAVPQNATLYVAGPRSATVYLNGHSVLTFQLNLDAPMGIRVFSCDVSKVLRAGRNVLAVEAVRGPDTAHDVTDRNALQLTQGKVLLIKIVPAELGVVAPPLLLSDAYWKASIDPATGWESTNFDDRAWPAVESLGNIDNSIAFLQWNTDAGLYNWPGYDGISPFLEQYKLPAMNVRYVYNGVGQMQHVDALIHPSASDAQNEFRVQLPSAEITSESAPQIFLDFGREVVGRLAIHSDSDKPSDVTIQYGESEPEALYDPYLGINPLHVAAHATAYGPKSAFRYALVRFTGGKDTRYKSIQLAGITYPVTYRGFFESSDPRLNEMWTIGAYTAHLCMQDDIWDAPKRDRGRWMGDLDVSGRTIEDVFGNRFLMEQTLDKLIGHAPIKNNVNGIPGYSAFWITGEAEYYRHTGSKQQLAAFHDRLIELMQYMEKELDSHNLYANKDHSWTFVDWSPELYGETPEAWRATQMEFYAAFQQGVYLLNQMGDTDNAMLFEQRAAKMKAAAQQYLLDASTGSFGTRWQTNGMAVLSGVADPSQYEAIWKASLASVGHIKYDPLIITPYYNYYVVSAMAKMGHRQAALNWIRQYWGGMIDEGATSFWEGYDPSWYKFDFHSSLQADGMSGYRVSLAHGWSSGVTPWLMEQVLGIHSTGPAFSTVSIRPDLIDLQWAKGGEPTPRGMLNVSIRKNAGTETIIDLPPGTIATISVPVSGPNAAVTVNGKAQSGVPAEKGERIMIVISEPGHYVIHSQ